MCQKHKSHWGNEHSISGIRPAQVSWQSPSASLTWHFSFPRLPCFLKMLSSDLLHLFQNVISQFFPFWSITYSTSVFRSHPPTSASTGSEPKERASPTQGPSPATSILSYFLLVFLWKYLQLNTAKYEALVLLHSFNKNIGHTWDVDIRNFKLLATVFNTLDFADTSPVKEECCSRLASCIWIKCQWGHDISQRGLLDTNTTASMIPLLKGAGEITQNPIKNNTEGLSCL